ncbi:LysR family transcriptional regulator, partial [Piscinibacter sp.]|uniref:LysR family transcriptional regulator n=1 Tax=Piscinibacter sp. TaxID=1903157 RepID=UPI002F410956
MAGQRIPPIQCLLSFEALARLRSVSQAGEELNVTPSAVSHRIRQLETQLRRKLFARADFSLTADGAAYLAQVRPALKALAQAPGASSDPGVTQLRLAVTPTFSREILLPRLALFRHAYPEVELILQVSIPLLNVTAEDADLEIRFGAGGYSGVEELRILSDEVFPACSPEYLHEFGPFDGFASAESVARARLIRSPLEPWRTWFDACGIDLPEPREGSQFNDVGLMLDA